MNKMVSKNKIISEKEIQKYKLVIFDWDGTLMDSEQKIVNALDNVINDMELATRSHDELKNVIGLGLTQAIFHLYPEFSDIKNKQFADRYRSTFLLSNQPPPLLFNGVAQMISQLETSGVMLAVATGKSRQGLQHAMGDSGIKHYFHASRCADETCSKPNPQMLEELLDEFSLSANDAVMVGDTEYDMQMANNINMDAFAVTYGVHELHRLEKHQPLAICHDVNDLANRLNQCVISF
jgi:phosphoglycolate phosphatase